MEALLTVNSLGLYCERGGFYIDPWGPVPQALITHAHGDHARPGSASYRCAEVGVALLRRRLGGEANGRAKRASLLFCYALGKGQRILAELARLTDRVVFVHGAIEPLVECYRQAGVSMLPTQLVSEAAKGRSWAGELILAPPSAHGSPWTRRFGADETAFASGWMRIRGTRRRRGVDRGFVLSDHADWPALLRTIRETGARRVLTTHGYADTLARYLGEEGLGAAVLHTAYAGETGAE